jgi:hypothetical protein
MSTTALQCIPFPCIKFIGNQSWNLNFTSEGYYFLHWPNRPFYWKTQMLSTTKRKRKKLHCFLQWRMNILTVLSFFCDGEQIAKSSICGKKHRYLFIKLLVLFSFYQLWGWKRILTSLCARICALNLINSSRQRPIDMAKSQDMRFMLNPTNISHSKLNRSTFIHLKL